jgi:cysteine desulfurase family protein (TIGR01976 family)
MSRSFEVDRWRPLFPALERQMDGRPAVFMDGPAGSQVPRPVIDAVAKYLGDCNANGGGLFATSRESDALLERAHRGVADLLGAADPDLTVFGANMTTLTMSLARALSRTWKSGDEIVLTRMEHDANFTPWVQAARDAGATVREVAIRLNDCTLDLEDFAAKLGNRTKFVAVGAASNAVGTINPIMKITGMAHAAGARVFVDAVHYAPHALMDVAAWDCDFLVCSAYKFFGPHVGILYGRRELLEDLPVYKLRPSSNDLPTRWETGTQCHEGIAGTLAAVDYLAAVGRGDTTGVAGNGAPGDRRSDLRRAFEEIRAYERGLAVRLTEGLEAIPSLKVWGITDPERFAERCPTFAVTHESLTSREIAGRLAERGIFVWHGNYYALPLTEALGLEPHGAVRIGLLHYNTAAEVDRLLGELGSLA